MSSFSGSQFMNVFNQFYYSFSPSVAKLISTSPALKAAMRVALYPLIGILYAASTAYSVFGFSPEFGAVMAGVVSSSLIGIVYVSPLVAILLKVTGKRRNLIANVSGMKLLGTFLVASILLLIFAEVTALPILMGVATVVLVIAFLGSSALMVATRIAKRTR